MYGLDLEQLELLRQYSYIENILDQDGTIKPLNKSSILSSNFGKVPRVIGERIATILGDIDPYASLETIYNDDLKPGDTIGFRGGKEPEIYIVGKSSVPVLTTLNVSERDLVLHSFPEKYEGIEFDNSILDNHLLQSGLFRFVSGATNIDKDGNFYGHYTIPGNHQFLIGECLPYTFMKEIANQVIALSHSLSNNPHGIRKGSTISLTSAHVGKISGNNPISIVSRSRLLVAGKIGIDPLDKEKGIVVDYTAHNEFYPIFNGKIKGTKIQT